MYIELFEKEKNSEFVKYVDRFFAFTSEWKLPQRYNSEKQDLCSEEDISECEDFLDRDGNLSLTFLGYKNKFFY